MSTMRGILLRPITLSLRQIGHVHGAEERQQVMLAHAVELDVPAAPPSRRTSREQGAVDDALEIGLIAAGQESERLFGALGRAHEPFARRVLADLDQDLLHQLGDATSLSDSALWLHDFHRRVVAASSFTLRSSTSDSNRLRLGLLQPDRTSSRGHSPGKRLVPTRLQPSLDHPDDVLRCGNQFARTPRRPHSNTDGRNPASTCSATSRSKADI